MRRVKFIDFQAEIETRGKDYQVALKEVLDSGWFILGSQVKKFEEQFAQYLGVKHCIGVANGLEALQISLMSLGIGDGDEVITTPISAVATTLAIIAVGAKPIFVDTDRFGLINADLIPGAISDKTKAILPVHLYGNAVDLKKIGRICKQYELPLIEDACQAHGASLQGKKLGTFGEVGCFSFYPTKNLGAFGDGGAIVTNSKKIANTCYQLRDYGQKRKYVHTRYGLNSRLDELQAAILQRKLQRLDSDNKRRQALVKKYLYNLSGCKRIFPVVSGPVSNSNFHIFAIKTAARDKLQKYLATKNIPTLVHYPLIIPDQPFLRKKYDPVSLTNSRQFVKEVLSLPVHPYLTPDQITYISKNIIDFFD